MSDLQTGVSVSSNSASGTLKYVSDYTGFSSDTDLQSGNYIALHWSDPDASITSLKVGVVPSSIGADLVECINDTDRNGVFRITNKNSQVVRIEQSDGVNTHRQDISLRGLTLESETVG